MESIKNLEGSGDSLRLPGYKCSPAIYNTAMPYSALASLLKAGLSR